jgi:succinyl-CoA synthetase beta subunit
MDLLEYQAKELFREIGIPVLPSCRIDHPRDLKRLEISYPVVLKSQVPTGGRGKAGGIRFVENTIDAIAAARAIFSLPILGRYPQVLLAESRYDAEMELYLAVILDYSLARPVLLGSAQGGANIEEMISQIQRVVVEQEFSPFYARRLAMKMGLQGNLMESVSGIIGKMYQLFVQKDLDLVEINPLGISSKGELMALDGKISVNNSALGRHAELVSLASTIVSGDSYSPILDNPLTELNWIDTEGNMGIVCNSSCLAATTLDLIYQAKGKPASCLIVDGYANWDATASSSPVKQLQNALEQITETKGIKVVLLNILSSAAATQEVAEALSKHLLSQLEEAPIPSSSYAFESQNGTASSFRREVNNGTRILPRRKTLTTSLPHFVIRMIGEGIESTKERLAGLPVHWFDDLDQAVAKAISLAQSAVKQS